MKVVLIYPDLIQQGAGWPGAYHHGLGYIAAVLRRTGHDVSLLHMRRPLGKEEFLDQFDRLGSDCRLVGFTSTTNMFPFVVAWNAWIKERHPSVFTVCGGAHATLNPEESMKQSSLDAVCVGEGEEAIVELCDALDGPEITHIRNMWVRDGANVTRNPSRPLVHDLDSLPFGARDVFDYENLMLERLGRAAVMASRGCPYECTYCCNKALRSTYRGLGQYVRFRSVDHVLVEFKEILARSSFIKGFSFDDDILPLRKDWIAEFCQRYPREIGLPFACNVRPNLISEDLVRQFKEAGCWEIHMGIESGNDEVRTGTLNRRITRAQITEAFSLCRKYGIKLYSFNMVGIPGEGTREMLDTVKLNAELGVDTYQVSIFYPYPGTPLHQLCEEQDLIADSGVNDYFEDTTLKYPPDQRARIQFFAKHFRKLVRLYRMSFAMPRPISRLAVGLLDKAIGSYVGLRSCELAFSYLYPLYRLSVFLAARGNGRVRAPRPLRNERKSES